MPLRFLLLIGLSLPLLACATRDDVNAVRTNQTQTQSSLAQQSSQLDAINTQLNQVSEQNEAQRVQMAQLASGQSRLQSSLQASLPALATRVCPPVEVPECPKFPDLEGKIIFGEAETFYVSAAHVFMNARIDSGAATSSINAEELERFERDGADWARFNVRDPQSGEAIQLEVPIQRFVLIKQASAEEPDRRPVVNLAVGIGDKLYRSDFSLRDRSGMDFQLLIGRTFLQDIVLVDVSRQYVQPRYNPPAKSNASAATAKPKADDSKQQGGAD